MKLSLEQKKQIAESVACLCVGSFSCGWLDLYKDEVRRNLQNELAEIIMRVSEDFSEITDDNVDAFSYEQEKVRNGQEKGARISSS